MNYGDAFSQLGDWSCDADAEYYMVHRCMARGILSCPVTIRPFKYLRNIKIHHGCRDF